MTSHHFVGLLLLYFETDKFPWLFSAYFPIFRCVLFNEFNKYKNYLTNKLRLNNQIKNKKWLKFPHFPVFCIKSPDSSSLFKISWIFPHWKMFSRCCRFSSPCGNQCNYLSAEPLLNQKVMVASYKYIRRLPYLWWPVYFAPLMWPTPLHPGVGQPPCPGEFDASFPTVRKCTHIFYLVHRWVRSIHT